MTERFDELKARLPEIADVVNRFESDSQRDKAFDLLVSALGHEASITEPSDQKTKSKTRAKTDSTKKNASGAKKENKAKRTKSPGSMPTVVGSLDLDDGKPPFRDFVEEKQPKTMVDKSMAAIYWLDQKTDHPKVTLDLVYTVYRKYGWKTPAMPGNQLRQIASAHKYLNTSNANDITMTVNGFNFVEHELPKTSKK